MYLQEKIKKRREPTEDMPLRVLKVPCDVHSVGFVIQTAQSRVRQLKNYLNIIQKA